jgi:hypothetical protein
MDHEDALRAALKGLDWPADPPAGNSQQVLLRIRRRRLRRTGLAATVVAAAVVAIAAVASAGMNPGTDNTIAATDQSNPPSQATAGCAGMTVLSTGAVDGDLVLLLRNKGSASCEVRGLEIATRLSQHTVRDQATSDDFIEGDPVAEGPLAPGGAILIRAATDTCQSAGAPVEVTFSDTTTLDLTFPDKIRAGVACVEPDFDLEITMLGISTDLTPAPGLELGEKYATRDFPTNPRGQTYGSNAEATTLEQLPDLVAVQGDDGNVGFVRKDDLRFFEPLGPEGDADRRTKAKKEGPVPVYDLDGTTVIDSCKWC